MPEAVSATEPFVLLADPASYVACDWDLSKDKAGRDHWLAFFVEHIRVITGLGVAAAVARGESETSANARAAACCLHLEQGLADYAKTADAPHERVTILTLDEWRDAILREHGFTDAFVDLKRRENEKMLPLLSSVVTHLDALPESQQLQAAIEGVFAGNIFDMGAKATAQRFLAESVNFSDVLASLPARPWLIDDFDAFAAAASRGYRRVVFFIDNAGSDFLLGAIPLMRLLARRGASVVIAANERPTLNDMTVHDVREFWPQILRAEPSVGSLPIEIVSSGTGEPLIDLSKVSSELNAAARNADLVVLEGMGRGVESNLHAEFSCDAINLAMLKDEAVARRHGGKVFDVVCRFRHGKSPIGRPKSGLDVRPSTQS
jgi:damage-control phosphatase, subfamily II, stand-alone protein